jgi:penicillin-binding protein 1A
VIELWFRPAFADRSQQPIGAAAAMLKQGDGLPGEVQLKAILKHSQLIIDYDQSGRPTVKMCRCAVPVSFHDIPSSLVWALIDTEDRRFYHWSHLLGFDPIGMITAVVAHLSGSRRGGSSLVQQIAKNLVLGGKYTIERKAQELILALRIAHILSKEEVLATYLNTVDFGAIDGQNVVGIEQAARTYFRKAPRDLNLFESAVLVGMLKAPTRYNPATHPEAARRRAELVLALMLRQGHVTNVEVRAALHTGPKPGNLHRIALDTGYYNAWILRALEQRPALLAARPDRLVIGLDPELQINAQSAIFKMLEQADASEADAHQAALIAMDSNGTVRALVGGRDFKLSQFDRATVARRPAGSTFKPFVYLPALETGRSPTDMVLDEPFTFRESRKLGVPIGWPANFDGYEHRPITLERALVLSKNAATARLAMSVGLHEIAETARRLGMRNARLTEMPSMALGACEVTPLELTGAYAAFANGGYRAEPHGILLALTPNGGVISEESASSRNQVVRPAIAAMMARMLHEVIKSGTGWRANFGSWAAGKTGTSQDDRDAWFVGFDRQNSLVTTVWIGNDDNSPMNGVSGATLPAQAWRRFYASLNADHGRGEQGRVARSQ